MWLVCLTGVVVLGASAQVGVALAGDITRAGSVMGLPFALDGAKVMHVALTKLMIASVALLPVLTLEAALCGARDCSVGRLLFNPSTSVVYDWVIMALDFMSAWRLIEVLFSLGGLIIVSNFLARMVSDLAVGGWQLSTGYAAMDAMFAFLLFTLSDYCAHRLFHMRRFFPLHRMHHSANEMTVATLWRKNPGVAMIEAFFKVWPFMLFNVPFGIVTGVGLSVMAYDTLIHSNIPWTWGWFGRWVLHPPAAHRLHHSIDPQHLNRNLGSIVFWDRLFNTWMDPRIVVTQVGVDGGPDNTGNLLGEILRDLRVFFIDQWRGPSESEPIPDVTQPAMPPTAATH